MLAIMFALLSINKNHIATFAKILDNFFRFNKNRPLYFTSIIQALLLGYITNLITNSRLQKELDQKDVKIDDITKENKELGQVHKNDLLNQSDAAKAIINGLQDEIKYQKSKKNTYKEALNGSVCLWKKAPIVGENIIITEQEETATIKPLGNY